MTSEARVRIRIELDQDSDGWPPFGSESLWAEHISGELYRIDNVPWFARDLAWGDVVRASSNEGDPWITEVVERSDHLTLRVIPSTEGPYRGDLAALINELAAPGVTAEGLGPGLQIVALDIEPTADIAALKRRLVVGEADGQWYFEEGVISDEWRTLPST